MQKLWKIILGILNIKHTDPVSEAIHQIEDMQSKAVSMEHATLTWTTAELTEDQQRDAGLIE